MLVFLAGAAQAGTHPKARSAAQTEARNETAAPSFSAQVRDAHRITSFLVDALVLNTAQLHAVQACTVAERESLALAATEADVALAQRQYLGAVQRLLVNSQLCSYMLLRQRLVGTTLPLEGTEIARR
jgi:hypothetical protein